MRCIKVLLESICLFSTSIPLHLVSDFLRELIPAPQLKIYKHFSLSDHISTTISHREMSRWLTLCLYWHHSGAIMSVTILADISQYRERDPSIGRATRGPIVFWQDDNIFRNPEHAKYLFDIVQVQWTRGEMDTHYQNQYEICIQHSGITLNQSKFRFNSPVTSPLLSIVLRTQESKLTLLLRVCVSRHLLPCVTAGYGILSVPHSSHFPCMSP